MPSASTGATAHSGHAASIFSLNHGKVAAIFYLLLSVAVVVAPFLRRVWWAPSADLADDAYYYLVVAENIGHGLGSVFLSGVPTNGYHPLWLLSLAGLAGLGVLSQKAMICLGLGLCALTSFITLAYLRPRRVDMAIGVAILIWLAYRATAGFTGMESALVILFSIWATLELYVRDRARDGVLVYFGPLLLAAACGARLDFVLIALPLLACAPFLTVRQKIHSLIALAILGAAYLGLNQVLFGSPLPISGEVKSLGGLQFNHSLVNQVFKIFTPGVPAGTRFGGMKHELILIVPFYSIILTALLALIVAVIGVVSARVRALLGTHRVALSAAMAIGLALYLAKLFFGSSWTIWVWYDYPIGLSFVFLIWLVQGFAGLLNRRRRRGRWVAGLGLVVMLSVYAGANAHVRGRDSFKAFNYAFVQANRSFLSAHRDEIAMGDRAGSLAYFLGRPHLFQLEGLVMGPAYFRQLRQRKDIRSYLCGRGVRIVLSAAPLDARGQLPMMRPSLTDYRGAFLNARDLRPIMIYQARRRFGDMKLRVWQLACK